MTWNSAKPYENRRDVNMKTWKKMKKFSLQAAFDTFLLLDVLCKAGVESWSTTFKMGSFFDEKLKSSPSSLDKCEGYQPLNDFIKLLNQVKMRNIRPKKALLQHCRRSNIESYTCCGCRQLKNTLMNYASTNTRNQAGVQSTPPPLIFVLEGLYQQYHAWIYVAIGCVNLTSISE